MTKGKHGIGKNWHQIPARPLYIPTADYKCFFFSKSRKHPKLQLSPQRSLIKHCEIWKKN